MGRCEVCLGKGWYWKKNAEDLERDAGFTDWPERMEDETTPVIDSTTNRELMKRCRE